MLLYSTTDMECVDSVNTLPFKVSLASPVLLHTVCERSEEEPENVNPGSVQKAYRRGRSSKLLCLQQLRIAPSMEICERPE